MELKNIPALICSRCATVLNSFYSFRVKCLKSDEYFHKLTATAELEIFTNRSHHVSFDAPESEFSESESAMALIKIEPYDIQAPTVEVWDWTNETLTQETFGHISTKPGKLKKYPESRTIHFCEICQIDKKTARDLKIHIISKHTSLDDLPESEIFVCDICGKRFKSKRLIRDHSYLHKHRGHFACHCGHVSPSKRALAAHAKRHEKNQVTCEYCAKIFVGMIRLKRHIARIHKKKLS